MVATLRRLGLKRIGQLYDIPRAALERRFPGGRGAAAVLRRLDQALGSLAEPRRSLSPEPVHNVQRLFTDPLLSAAGVEAETASLVTDLCEILAEADAGARRLRLSLTRVDGGAAEILIGTSSPCRAPRHLMRLIGEKLDGLDAGFGIDGLQLAALRVERLAGVQTNLAGAQAGGEGGGAALLVDRLANRLGAAWVTRLQALASHIPERAQVRQPLLASVPSTAQPMASPRVLDTRHLPPRPPLLLSPPEPVTVLAEVPEGPPIRFKWRRVLHRIVKAEGPERIESEWWRALGAGKPPEPVRDYYRIEDEMGRRYWLFRAGRYGAEGATPGGEPPRWYLHGVFG